MLKTGLWQILEIITVVLGLSSAYFNHGKALLTQEKFDEYQKLPEALKSFAIGITFLIYLFMGPVIAFNGGCRGVYLLLYVAMTSTMFVYAVHLMNGSAVVRKHSFTRSLCFLTIYNVLLYLGGFWTEP